MPVKNCGSCGRPRNIELSRCPWCGSTAGAQQPAPKPPSPPPPTVDASNTVPCRFCQGPVAPAAVRCQWCGEALGRPPQTPAGTPQPPPPPPRYAPRPPPKYAYRQAPDGTTPLVLGILGLVLCGILAPFAWWLGSDYEAKCRALRVKPGGAGKAGKILGIIGTVLLILSCCGVGAWIAFAAAGSASW